jgi:UDP-N-acetylmuramate dehydrogenase
MQRNVPLAPFTTLKIGGNAQFFVKADTPSVVEDAVGFAERNSLDLFVLGGGSNVLISDAGFDGLVLQIAVTGIASEEDRDGHTVITAGAGGDWDALVSHCVERGLAGVECLSGIPGLIGGTPVQNVGAYGQEVSETIELVRCFDRQTSGVVTLTKSECGFSYRTSVFNSTRRGRYIVLSVTFRLKNSAQAVIAYKDLIEHIGDRRPSIGEVREAILKIRRSKSMVIDESDPNSKSAGSFFKNPIVERNKLYEIKTGFDHVPHFEFGDKVKIPAAWLIEKAGFKKGFTLGNAGISSNHNLALINRGGATAGEMLSLERKIREAVDGKFGIVLTPEPVFIGFES